MCCEKHALFNSNYKTQYTIQPYEKYTKEKNENESLGLKNYSPKSGLFHCHIIYSFIYLFIHSYKRGVPKVMSLVVFFVENLYNELKTLTER